MELDFIGGSAMGKKKKQLEKDKQDLLEILTGKELGPEQLRSILDIATRLPPEIYLSAFLIAAWSMTHKGLPNIGDVMLGTIGGFTLMPAMRGGTAANIWATSYLGALGYNAFDDLGEEIIEEITKAAEEAGEDVARVVTNYKLGRGFVFPIVRPPPIGIIDPEQ